MPVGEEGIETKDFSTSLQRRDGESGRSLTTDCSSNKRTCVMSTDHIMRMSSETGVPILELAAMSPVTKKWCANLLRKASLLTRAPWLAIEHYLC